MHLSVTNTRRNHPTVNDGADLIDRRSARRDRAALMRARIAAIAAGILAITMLALFIAFAQRLSTVTDERDQFARAAGRPLSELEGVSDLADRLETSEAEAADLTAELAEMTSTAEEQAASLERLDAQLDLYGAPDDPDVAPVTIEGRWDVAWADQPLACIGFDGEASCEQQKVLKIISTTEADTSAVRVSGGARPSSNLDYRMAGTETTSFFCEGRPNTTTHVVTFRVVGADLAAGVLVATRIEGELEVTTESSSCAAGTIRWQFTATRVA